MSIEPFSAIWDRAVARKGAAAVEARLGHPKPVEEVAAVPDDRVLSIFSRFVFSTGLNWSVIEKKWPGHEAAFWNFDLGRCAMMSDDDEDALLKNAEIIRHAAKIRSVRDNAVFLRDLAAEHGSAARCIAAWPVEDLVGLLAMMKTRGSRLGGTTAQYMLRFLGKDGFVLGRDVAAALVAAGVVAKAPSSKRDMAAVQAAFNGWAEESGRPLMQISQVLAMSTGPQAEAAT